MLRCPGVGNCQVLKSRGWGIYYILAKKIQIPGVLPGGDGNRRNLSMHYPDGMVVNWSHLTQQYNIKNTEGELAKNGGQIAKKWLKSEGIDTTRFKHKHNGNDGEQIRRKKLRGQVGGLLLRHHKVLIE